MRHPAWFVGVALVALAACCSCGCTSSTREVVVALSPATSDARSVAVAGLNRDELNSIATLPDERREAVLRVWVADAPAGAPSLLGEVARRGDEVLFVPRYPFRPGLRYRARFDPTELGRGGLAVETEFTVAAPPREPMVRVAAVYPSGDELPENLLKFYIHFSGSMGRGEAYEHVRLMDDSGKVVERPFLELGEELWDPGMTRFTLFFEPGRIKQGLVPRMEMGPALVAGRRYTLVVDGGWRDGEGRPLVGSFEKTFRVVGADVRQPDPGRWKVEAPGAGSRGELVVRFDEALDQGMLQHVISVRDEGGRVLAGRASVGEGERRWGFTPAAAWGAGRYVLEVETILEDVAGNSIGRAFEVDLKGRVGEKPVGEVVEVPFDVGRK